jgi:hypothetical protein
VLSGSCRSIIESASEPENGVRSPGKTADVAAHGDGRDFAAVLFLDGLCCSCRVRSSKSEDPPAGRKTPQWVSVGVLSSAHEPPPLGEEPGYPRAPGADARLRGSAPGKTSCVGREGASREPRLLLISNPEASPLFKYSPHHNGPSKRSKTDSTATIKYSDSDMVPEWSVSSLFKHCRYYMPVQSP